MPDKIAGFYLHDSNARFTLVCEKIEGERLGTTCSTHSILLKARLSLPRLYFKEHCLGPVHTYPDIFESATFSFRIWLPFTRIRRIRQRIRKKINPLSRVEKNKSATNPITCGRVNPDIFESDDVKSVPSLSPNNKPIWRHNVEGEQSKFPATISLYGPCSEDILVQRSLGY